MVWESLILTFFTIWSFGDSFCQNFITVLACLSLTEGTLACKVCFLQEFELESLPQGSFPCLWLHLIAQIWILSLYYYSDNCYHCFCWEPLHKGTAVTSRYHHIALIFTGTTLFVIQVIGNEAKRRISKRVFQESKARQNFRKTNISYPLIRTRTCAYQGIRNVCFSEIFSVLCFLETPVLRFALLPYYRRSIYTSQLSNWGT